MATEPSQPFQTPTKLPVELAALSVAPLAPPRIKRQLPLATGYMSLGDVVAPRQPVFGTDDEELCIVPHSATALAGEVVVLSGQFPSKGAGDGEDDLRMGKSEMAEEVAACGGRVVGGMSKKVTLLVVGARPGRSKCDEAAALKVQMVDVDGVTRMMRGEKRDAIPPPDIPCFSEGYKKRRTSVAI